MAHRLSLDARADLDELWLFVASNGSVEAADRLVDAIAARFHMLAQHPEAGRRRDDDLRPGVRTFPVGEYVIAYRLEGDDVLILRVIRGSRDSGAVFGAQ